MSHSPDVVIVGGGAIGLSIAYTLGRQGTRVTVLDSDAPGRASMAAAGMLAPLAESGQPGAFSRLAIDGLRRWPSFVAQLREDVASPLELLGPGMLRVARTEAEEETLCAAMEWQGTLDLPLFRLEQLEVRSLEPAISPDVRAAVFSSQEKSVDPRVLMEALTRACARHGAEIVPDAVTGFEISGAKVNFVRTTHEPIATGHIVIAGGAWSDAFGQMLGLRLPVAPLRGQILALGPITPAPFRHILYAHGGYLVPRPDGRIIAGATEESVGFAAETTDAGVTSQHRMSAGLVPSLAEAPWHSSWAGLRPVSADGLPLLGRLPGWDNVSVATGHGRNGILLSPLTGDLLAADVLHNAVLPAEFDPARFTETA